MYICRDECRIRWFHTSVVNMASRREILCGNQQSWMVNSFRRSAKRERDSTSMPA
ncbi:uncharacterized protein MYCFIDRAFT_181267 [Pseudocercospora fijiensis CIRAD86]|uniref:Uncharacterized protein n=1 Tax=Pseudocercospora fijiensis (strain CIRAD86) TaxID=383855 RepID=N1QBG0_PSEFD|nr:uncharacterized protein MYCFIDRAFT_181267 [Pseudocercospora fijiensis CIRAD86]EME88473.1 hypothetical protein MYCFIDRAFT_181267 [Pseudocercospora fijiensis CIRAD86]